LLGATLAKPSPNESAAKGKFKSAESRRLDKKKFYSTRFARSILLASRVRGWTRRLSVSYQKLLAKFYHFDHKKLNPISIYCKYG